MQVVISLSNSSRPRPSTWVSATGDYATVVSELMRHARRDLNLTQAEHDEIEALVKSWTPSDGYPLSKTSDLTRLFNCDDFTLSMTARSPERREMIGRELDELLAAPNSNHNSDALL